MIEDLRTAPEGTRLEADVCIVGAGPAGIALAQALSAGGLSVLLIESGGLSIEPAGQDLDIVEAVGSPQAGAPGGRARALGGAGRLWAGQCLRLDEMDFHSRPWIAASGWPIGRETLSPFYDKAEVFFGVHGLPTDQTAYTLFSQEPVVWAPDTIETMFTVYTRAVDVGRRHKSSLRQARNVRVILHATVVHIDTSGGQATGLRLRSPEGGAAQAVARAYVLCAGGIENARLLLVSDEQQPAGLGNAHDLVGRYFQEHPNGVTATVEQADATALQSRFRLLYGKNKFFPKFRLSEQAQRGDRVGNANAHLIFIESETSGLAAIRAFAAAARRRRLPARSLRHAMALARDAALVGRAALARMRGGAVVGPASAVRLQCYLEQTPNPDSRVVLGNERDRLSLRRARIDWQLTEVERRTCMAMTAHVESEFARLGLGRLRSEGWLLQPGDDWKKHLSESYHPAGTTRMADSATHGVVGPTLEVFGVSGLYACGSSVFPTSGYANPTLTIVALALRLAEHLIRQL